MTQQLAYDIAHLVTQTPTDLYFCIWERSRMQDLQLTTISIQTKDGGEVPVSVLVVPRIATLLQNPVPNPGDHYPYLRDLQLAQPVGCDNKEISLLIGADFYWNVIQDKIVWENGPTAMESKIGYLLSGPLSSPHFEAADDEVLHVGAFTLTGTNLTQFWEVEFMGTLPTAKSTTNYNQQFFTAYLDSSARQQSDGSYVVHFPWKMDHPPLPSNRSICER